MSRIRTTTRLILVFSMLIAALASSQASAQRPGDPSPSDEGSYESELTGLEFSWSDDWELASSDATEDDELIEIDTDLGLVRTGFAISEDDAEWGRDQVLDEVSSDVETFEVVDEDSNRDLSWSLVYLEPTAGEPFVLYIEVVEDFSDDFELVTLLLAEEQDFLDLYELVYDTVEVDGDPILDQFDVDEIEELVVGGAAVEDEEVTPATTDEDESETGRGDDTASELGDSYAFEMDDIEVVVSEDVEINEVQVEEGTYEQILLVGVGSIGAVSLLQSPGDAEGTLDGFMGGFLSEMEDSREIEFDVEGEIAWGLWEANVGGMDMYIYAMVNDDLYDGHYLELVAAPVDFFEDEFIAYQESVEINGDGMFDGIDVDDLLDIIDAS